MMANKILGRYTSRRNYSFKLLVVVSLLLIVTGSCSDSSSTGPDTDFPEIEGFDAKLGSETSVIEEHIILAGLIEKDGENNYTFDSDVLTDAEIDVEPGKILLLWGEALVRVSSVTESDGKVKITTNNNVTLDEAFENATITWDESFRFTEDVAEKTRMVYNGNSFAPSKISDGKVEWEYSVGAYKVNGSVEALGSSAKVTVQMKKDMNTGGVLFLAQSVIQEFKNNTRIEIRDHETKSFDFENPGMQGNVDLTLAAAGGEIDPDFGIGPLAMFKFPFTVGPIPMVMSVSVQTVAKLHVRGQASAQATTSFSYNGLTGISYDGTNYSTKVGGGIDQPNHQGGSGDSSPGGFDGIDVDAQYGFAAPIFQLEMFGNTIVPFIRPEFFVGSNLKWGPLCKTITARYGINAGIDLRFLGKKIASSEEIEVVPEQSWESYSDEQNCSQHQKLGIENFSNIHFDHPPLLMEM